MPVVLCMVWNYYEGMKSGERLSAAESGVTLEETEAGQEIRGATYRLLFQNSLPYITLSDADGNAWADLLTVSGLTTTTGREATFDISPPSFTTYLDGTLEVRVRSTTEETEPKEQVWRCRADSIETYVTALVSGKLTEIELFGGVRVGPNMFGESMSQRYFSSVYNPQPSEMERPVIPARENTHITTSGMWQPGRRRAALQMVPCLGFSRSAPKKNGTYPAGPWLMAGLSAPIEEQNMIEYAYVDTEDGFSLKAIYDGLPLEGGRVQSPSLMLFFASTPQHGLAQYAAHARRLGHLKPPERLPDPALNYHNTMVTWGIQLEEELARRKNGEKDVRARDLLTTDLVLNNLHVLQELDAPVDRVVLDDKWQEHYGTNTPKSPDWYHLIEILHSLDILPVLWVKANDAEGLPEELCILDAQGRPIASDPTNPNYIECMREQVRYMASPSGMDADGFKIDFLGQLPHGPGLRWYGKERGQAALYKYLSNLSEAAKAAKPSAFVQTHALSPWFAGVIDELRINDTNFPLEEDNPAKTKSPIRTLGERVRVTRSLLPDHPIDYDGWPMRDIPTFLRYVRAQARMGRETIHFTTSINGEPLTEADLQTVAQSFRRAHEVGQRVVNQLAIAS